ncbi:MopE-related protein [Lutibacter citreus]|uniref:MopE-related protein n=1 Tax=Lutibacter citreus TaxID=2138210 RepID=UPI000DBE82A3|nr:MopE-related protein [Lutibacter citreus]
MKRLLLLVLLIGTVFQGFSQTKGISYQAVILNPQPQELPGQNAQNNILANSSVSIQFTIVNTSGTEEYQEQHSTRTDMYGMINLLIGTGSPTSSTNFTDIVWDGTTKKLKVGIDFNGGSNFSPLSEQNLTYMPQPANQETTQLITKNAAYIEAESERAKGAEQTNATSILAIEAEQTTQNAAILLNTGKVGITTAQATTISNTTGINTGDQDISGIVVNATSILAIEAEQTNQNAAILLNTGKVGITTAQATTISNTTGINTGDQDISGIVVNTIGISDEKNRAEIAEEKNATAISNEKARASLAELANASAITTKVDKNVSITGGSKTKITYDSKGLVTSGTDATTTDIAEGTNLYYSEARVAANAAVAASTTHAVQTDNPHLVTKLQVGLGNVDNTSDADKPISTLTQTALDGKVDENGAISGGSKTKITYDSKGLVTSGTDATTTDIAEGTNLYYSEARVAANTAVAASTTHAAQTDNPHSVTKAQVGLGNVDNTSDADKPISTLTQTSLDGKVDENVAITGGSKTKITYDSKGLVTAGADATTTDIAEGTNLYYTEARVTANTAVAASATHAAKTDNPHSVTKLQVGLGNVDNTSDADKPISTLTQTQLNAKADLTLSNLLNASSGRTNLGLAIGTDVQAYDADLDDLADGTLSANKVENAITTSGTSGEVWTSDGSGAGIWKVPANSVIKVGAGLVISGAGTVAAPYNISLPTGGTTGQVLTIGSGGVPTWEDSSAGGTIYYLDVDGDGYGDVNESIVAVSKPSGYVSDNTDCDDTDISINQAETWYIDADSDGYGVSSMSSCIRPANGYLLSELSGTGTDDCNDTDANEKPGVTWYIDADGDGYPSSSTVSCVRPSNGYLLSELLGTETDCKDSNSAINPGATEVCDGIDNNCNGSIDEGLTYTTYYIDADGDGYGDSNDVGTSYCSNPGAGFKTNNTDCDDSNSAINPGRAEIGGNSIDENCDGNLYVVGDYVAGGVVFYVPSTPTDLNSDGVKDFGLVCSIEDLTSVAVKFSNDTSVYTGVADRRKGFGKSNTDWIAANLTCIPVDLTLAYRGGGYSDWFLPTQDELTSMYNNKDLINATAALHGGSDFLAPGNAYWSSYVVSNVTSRIKWTTGSSSGKPRTDLYGVRAIRVF